MNTPGRWRAVNEYGAVLDILFQPHRDTGAARTFFGRLLGEYEVPEVIHTDKLWSYGAAIRELPVLHTVEHVQVASTVRCNNLIEQSHVPPGIRSDNNWASSDDDGPRSSWPCMPESRTFTSTPESLE